MPPPNPVSPAPLARAVHDPAVSDVPLRDASDADLVVRARGGEVAAFGALYERYAPRVLRFAVARLSDAEEAQDVVQETFLEALRGLHGYRGDAPLSTWLAGIAYRRIGVRYRARRRAASVGRRFREELAWPAAPPVEDAVDARRSLERCGIALARSTSPAQQRVFQLRYGQSRSVATIARDVRRSRESVKVSLFRTRRKLLREVPGLSDRLGA